MRMLALAPLALVAGCSVVPATPAPAPAPPPARPVPTPPPAPAPAPVDWRDAPLTPGDWVYRQDARGSIALFGPVSADAELTLRCDRGDRQIYLSRRGAGTGAMTVRTTSVTRSLPSRPTGGTPAYMAVALATTDPLLDAMGYSRGRFVVEQAPSARLVVPAWAEVLRVVEDCRRTG